MHAVMITSEKTLQQKEEIVSESGGFSGFEKCSGRFFD